VNGHPAPTGIDPAVYAQALADIRALTDRTGTGYVRPERRVTVWRHMAADLAAEGSTIPMIAEALCVSEETVNALLGQSAPKAVAA
jgi:DNA-binding NarL/FixJ family response regulator